MVDDPHRKMTPAASEGHLTASSTASTDAMKLAMYHAKLILGSYRADQANDPEIYVTAISHLLSRYPKDIGARLTDPKDGVAGKYKWLPSVSEVREEAEALIEAESAHRYRRQEMRKQFELRAEQETLDKSESPEYRKKVVERIKNEMREHGFKFAGDEVKHRETPETVRKRLNISQEQWDAIPNAPNTWKQAGT